PAALMYRAPVRPQRSPGAPRPAGRFPSPASCWGFPGARFPYGGHRGGSPRGGPAFSPGSPVYSPGSHRGYRDGSPAGFGSGSRGFGDSPAGFGSGSRGFGGQMRRRGGSGSSDSSVEKYFSPSMLQDPWAAMQPIGSNSLTFLTKCFLTVFNGHQILLCVFYSLAV
uniref:M-phase specific PLK1 interacting protein n=1 Tax=Dicentrarchus labrax TaxID=13489 RepID=A0A8C4DKI2_DICLA